MLSTVRQIGNSRGVLIPAAFLALCQIEDQVDMRFEDGAIIIKPVNADEMLNLLEALFGA